MKIHRAYFVFLLACLASLVAVAQEDSSLASASIEHYALKVAVDEGSHLLQCEAHLQLRLLKDSVSQIRFTFASSMELISVRDSLDKKIENKEQSSSTDNRCKEVLVFIPDTLKRGDSLFLKIVYEAAYDTGSTLPLFINDKEIFLASDDSVMWFPVLSPATNPSPHQVAPAILEVTLPSSFTIVSSGEIDSLHILGSKTTWKFIHHQPLPLASCFLLCASKDFVKNTILSADSVVHISLYFDATRFDKELAEAVLQQLRDAFSFFALFTHAQQKHTDIRIVVIGTDDGHAEWFSSNGVIVGRNSFAYSVFDSTLLFSSQKNKWVHEFSHFFGAAAQRVESSTADSNFWFNEGWANYLTTKYFLHKAGNDADAQRRTRLELLSTTLDFYPTQTLAQGRRSNKNESAAGGLFFKKGAYVFLMLEYIIGEDAFAIVRKKMYEKFVSMPIAIAEFQQLCEEAHGSSLDWFFKEWVYQTGFPELILTTDATQTNRGNYLLKAKISQRGDVFTTPVDLVFSNNVRSVTKRALVEKQDQEYEFILPFLPTKSELDPNYYLLRWVPRLRLLAHARTAVSFRVFDRDLANSEREAMLTLQLDPNNLTGWNNIALFALGKSAVIKGEMVKAEEYFRRASALEANEPTQLYSVLSLVRLGNVLEMQGKRDEAVELYKLSATLAERNPVLYSVALFEARKYLHEKFISSDEFWYGEY